MDRYHPDSRVKPITAYLKESVKFYELDKPMPARIIFLLELAVLFGGYIFAVPYTQDLYKYFEQISNKFRGQLSVENLMNVQNSELYANMMNAAAAVLLIYAAIRAVSFFISLLYGAYYFFGLTSPEMKGGARVALFFSRLPKLLLFNAIFYIAYCISILALAVAAGIISIIVPFPMFWSFLMFLAATAINALFVFKDLLIIEFDVGIFKNFRKSVDLTRSGRKNLIINMMWPMVIGWVLNVFALDVNNAALSIFISAFLEVIILLAAQRLTVLMFIDAASLERKDGRRRPADTAS